MDLNLHKKPTNLVISNFQWSNVGSVKEPTGLSPRFPFNCLTEKTKEKQRGYIILFWFLIVLLQVTLVFTNRSCALMKINAMFCLKFSKYCHLQCVKREKFIRTFQFNSIKGSTSPKAEDCVATYLLFPSSMDLGWHRRHSGLQRYALASAHRWWKRSSWNLEKHSFVHQTYSVFSSEWFRDSFWNEERQERFHRFRMDAQWKSL